MTYCKGCGVNPAITTDCLCLACVEYSAQFEEPPSMPPTEPMTPERLEARFDELLATISAVSLLLRNDEPNGIVLDETAKAHKITAALREELARVREEAAEATQQARQVLADLSEQPGKPLEEIRASMRSEFPRFSLLPCWHQCLFGVSYFPGMGSVNFMLGPFTLIVRGKADAARERG